MNVYLTDRQRKIIVSLRTKDAGKNVAAFDNLEKGEVSLPEIGVLCNAINDEFMMEGIQPNFEPNEYGLELEGLLDVINGPRLKP